MPRNLSELIDTFSSLHVLVIGEAILDSYLEGTANRLSREAPVPIVTLGSRTDAPGGAANTAANVRSLGGRVTLLSVIGDDPESHLLRQALEASGVSWEQILVQPSRRTLAKHRVIADGQILVRYDQGDTDLIDTKAEAALIERLIAFWGDADAVIVADNACGSVTPRVIQALVWLQSSAPRLLVVDARDLSAYRQVRATAIKPNYHEAIHLLGQPEVRGMRARAQQIASQAGRVFELTGAQIAAITLDAEGALVLDRTGPPYRTYARPIRPASGGRTAGAGDTYCSALSLALAAGAQTAQAAELAAAASAVVVGKEGTAVCSAEELRTSLSGEDKFVASSDALVARVAFHRQQGRRIIFTNGCFDILHSGHITYLNRAKALGDILIVGLNADGSVRRLKGPGRPINRLEDRAQVLAALSSIDYIIAFDEDTPSNLIRAVRPDIFVKGGDYTLDTLPEAPLVEELGGAVQILAYVEDHSTTGIIERIRADRTRSASGG